MSYNPLNPNGLATQANSSPVVLDTTNTGYLQTIATNTGAQATDFVVNSTIVAFAGAVSITGQGVYTVTASITGSWVATLVFEGQLADNTWAPIPATIQQSQRPFPEISSTTTNGTYIITGGGYMNIRVRASAFTSGPVLVGLEASFSQQTIYAITAQPDNYITGAAAQTVIVNNILTSTSGTAPTEVSGFKSFSVQLVSTATGGTFIFEGSNDGVNFQTAPVFNQALTAGTAISAAITSTATQLIYTGALQYRYLRLRIVTTITGGSIQSILRLSQASFAPTTLIATQATAANLATSAVIASGTVTTVSAVTSAALAAAPTTDIASAAITITTTSAAVSTANVLAVSFNVAVTAFSGTTPTLDIVVQESLDNVNWFDVYQFERITSAGVWVSPAIKLIGQQVRYVRTVTGTTPSFTMSLIRNSRSVAAPRIVRTFDRTIAPNTLNSTTPTLQVSGISKIQIVQSSAAGATVAPVITLQGSEDATNWYSVGTTPITVTATASTTSSASASVSVMPKYVRGIVTTAGVSAVLNYISLTGME